MLLLSIIYIIKINYIVKINYISNYKFEQLVQSNIARTILFLREEFG